MIQANVLLIKPSPSIFLKSERVKFHFNKKLRENIKCALNRAEIPFDSLEQMRGRMFLHSPELEKALSVLSKVFGIHALALAHSFSAFSLVEINDNALECLEGRLENQTFAVRASRSGEQDFSSQEIERSLGAAILDSFPSMKVNLSKPEITVSVEVRKETGMCYLNETRCFAGLPQGVEGNIAMFFSGEKEDLAAAFLLMKRGCNIYPVGENSKEVKDNLKQLEPWNCGRAFSLTDPSKLEQLISGSEILALASPESGVSKEDFADYAEKDKEHKLTVLRPLLFFPGEKIKEIVSIIKPKK